MSAGACLSVCVWGEGEVGGVLCQYVCVCVYACVYVCACVPVRWSECGCECLCVRVRRRIIGL